jgi:hypothetical protein
LPATVQKTEFRRTVLGADRATARAKARVMMLMAALETVLEAGLPRLRTKAGTDAPKRAGTDVPAKAHGTVLAGLIAAVWTHVCGHGPSSGLGQCRGAMLRQGSGARPKASAGPRRMTP